MTETPIKIPKWLSPDPIDDRDQCRKASAHGYSKLHR